MTETTEGGTTTPSLTPMQDRIRATQEGRIGEALEQVSQQEAQRREQIVSELDEDTGMNAVVERQVGIVRK
ncbi:hypothetical protein A2803_00660 [Candidatus Woesebacteria bacterium RIFCSPHIGHO2_01_FULL_44_21]|uniref:Uncharacterized protein n=1 Tax=Candidatus Woesebacteria bacterium RIFCSPHIGHO2_01_FULL_44_21 TaxID=1802503 RepID=A0A1F7YY12_9BACT|nr:MAG: hypothetical protein A2803_00660 [Candidatus Woesebacteria bacterium RIFCSPHIGHO2_01_FULL_44_21]OGM70374.1 MAG: hypothetical protein A2897_01090 [Candidatus Woesebacteria bacterium RIFCSPLOWO2_01_FULL_44_24b]